jgi:sugar O-acyltransferase (sialic acid O-acetyltransferase NeuD family)
VTARPLMLIGGGGLARETLELVRALNASTPTWDLVGVLDDDPQMRGASVGGVPVLGPSAIARDRPDAWVVASVASPNAPARRLELVERLALPPERYATLMHPAAVVPASASLAPGTIVHAGTVMTADVQVGAHVVLMPAVVLTHDDRIEDGVTCGAGVLVAGKVTIGHGAYIGAGARLREGITVGPNAVVGMGAVVTKSVPANEVWVGAPARLHSSPEA